MARILFAIELGGELGHVRACGGLANSLAARGHELAFVLSDLHDPAAIPVASPYALYRVRAGLEPGRAMRPASYAEILAGSGYRQAETLRPLADAWRARFEAWKPDLVVADYAPTALLAARALGIPRIHYGMGFSIPPRLDPLPSFRFDEALEPQRIPQANERALASVNEVLRGWGARPLDRLSQLLECDEEFLCTFPELDHYGERPASGYWGPRFETATGARVAWPARGGKRIFVYLKTVLPQLDDVIDLLAASEHRVAAFIPRLDEARRSRLEGGTRRVSREPIKLEGLLADCELAVTHGGQLTAGIASQGIPQLVFPLQFEQYITAHRVQQIGAGLWLGPRAARAEVAGAFRELLFNPAHARAARAFAERYSGFSPAEQKRRMVKRIEEVAARPRAARPILAASPDPEPSP